MSIQRTADISVINKTSGSADIVLFHSHSRAGVQRSEFSIGPGDKTEPLRAFFTTEDEIGDGFDYWTIMLFVKDGDDAGLYINTGSSPNSNWKKTRLDAVDAGQPIDFSVSAKDLNLGLRSGIETDTMTRVAPAARYPISHVFVVMLENHSFDNMLAMSGIGGIEVATTKNSNSYDGTTYKVQKNAPMSMPTDPGHEFADTLCQLCGPNATYPWGGTYPSADNSGFATSYATSTSEDTGQPTPSQIQDIMDCFDTKTQLPMLWCLARFYGVCDHWHASMPGPTWPNRFFLHGASSSGLDDSPTNTEMGEWEAEGFSYPNGSIFDLLQNNSIPCRFYSDYTSDYLSAYAQDPSAGSILGAVPQASIITNMSMEDFYSLEQFASDLQGHYPYPYTFIEPHYGDVTGDTYAGGSSQHPMDDAYGGDNLLKGVFSAIRNSPYWKSSLLVIIYDEHGGYYDHVRPPSATAPDDGADYGYSVNGFTFETLGVRVPAVLVSPLLFWTDANHDVLDHSSVPKLLEDLWGLSPLTKRDQNAKSPLAGFVLGTGQTEQVELPPLIPRMHAPNASRAALRQKILAQPLPKSGSILGVLANLKKTDAKLTTGGRAAVQARTATITTRGDVERYAAEVFEKIKTVQAARRPQP